MASKLENFEILTSLHLHQMALNENFYKYLAIGSELT